MRSIYFKLILNYHSNWSLLPLILGAGRWQRPTLITWALAFLVYFFVFWKDVVLLWGPSVNAVSLNSEVPRSSMVTYMQGFLRRHLRLWPLSVMVKRNRAFMNLTVVFSFSPGEWLNLNVDALVSRHVGQRSLSSIKNITIPDWE